MSSSIYIDRLSHLVVVTASGERKKVKGSSWLSTKEIVCPNCGRVEYGNIDQEKFKLCSLCLMNGCIKAERQENLAGVGLASKPRGLRAARREGKPCERCRENFHGRSNRQMFCEKCQKWNEETKNRERQARFSRNQPNSHGLTV